MPKRKKNAPPEPPLFFCDNCGAEVPQNSKNCPSCGRFFSSVRCPYCGFVGEEALFSKGCPSCGYSASPVDDAAKSESKKEESHHIDPGLPLWVFILMSAIFTAILTALLFRIFH